MARSHGRVMATIWNDPDFLALEEGPQRLYLFLLSQPDLSHAGLVPMRIRRWAKKVANCTTADIEKHLNTLADSRFLLVDDETEEVLIRTFVRNDGVYKQPKVMLRMREDARQIESATLRAAFSAELHRLPLDELSTAGTGRDGEGPSTQESVRLVVDTLCADFDTALGYPSEGVSDTHSDTPRVRAGAFHQPPTTVPHPPTTVPTTSGAGKPGAELALRDEPTSQTLLAEWIDHCAEPPPSRVKGHVAKEIKTLLSDGVPYERVRSGLAEWNALGLHPSTLPSVVHGQANRKPRTTRQNETDALFERAMARAAVEGDQR